jgi:hypothetical protein
MQVSLKNNRKMPITGSMVNFVLRELQMVCLFPVLTESVLLHNNSVPLVNALPLKAPGPD